MWNLFYYTECPISETHCNNDWLETTAVWQCYVTLYIYCPVWRETWRFVQPRSSCRPTYWAINCLLYRKLKENLLSRKHVLNRSFAYFGLSFSVSETWCDVLWCHSPSCGSAVSWDMTGRHNVWRETGRFVFTPRDCSRPIIFLDSSYQFYEVQ